jgi:hypothetical protein
MNPVHNLNLFIEKVKLYLCLMNHALRHKDVWGSGGIAPPFLTSALDGGELSSPCPGHFTFGTHWRGGWVGPRTGLDAVEYRTISRSHRESNPGYPVRTPSLYWPSYPGSYLFMWDQLRTYVSVFTSLSGIIIKSFNAFLSHACYMSKYLILENWILKCIPKNHCSIF